MANLTLPGTIAGAPNGAAGFDVNQVLTAAQAQAFKNAGYAFCVRYVPRTSDPKLQGGNLTHTEALDILNAGLALMAVQHVELPPWKPTTNLGTLYGKY